MVSESVRVVWSNVLGAIARRKSVPLNAAIEASIEASHPGFASALLRRVPAGSLSQVSPHTILSLMKACNQAGSYRDCINLFPLISLSDYWYKDRIALLEESSKSFLKLAQTGDFQEEEQKIFKSWIPAYAKVCRIPALDLCREMSFSSLLLNECNAVRYLWNVQKQIKLFPARFSLHVHAKAASALGDNVFLEEVHQCILRSLKTPSDLRLHTTLILCLKRARRTHKALEICGKLLKSNLSLDLEVLTMIMKLYQKYGYVQKALKTYQQISTRGLIPDDLSKSHYVTVLLSIGRFSEAQQVLDTLSPNYFHVVFTPNTESLLKRMFIFLVKRNLVFLYPSYVAKLTELGFDIPESRFFTIYEVLRNSQSLVVCRHLLQTARIMGHSKFLQMSTCLVDSCIQKSRLQTLLKLVEDVPELPLSCHIEIVDFFLQQKKLVYLSRVFELFCDLGIDFPFLDYSFSSIHECILQDDIESFLRIRKVYRDKHIRMKHEDFLVCYLASKDKKIFKLTDKWAKLRSPLFFGTNQNSPAAPPDKSSSSTAATMSA
jgi:pentatricopeptide repeat protein